MWTDRNRDAVPGRSASSNEPEASSESAGAIRNLAVIGKGMLIKGHIRSKESLRIDGEVEGRLDVSDCRLTIGREGKVAADTNAREIELLGTVIGNLEATSKITIRKGARLVGDLRAPGILIEEGAYVKGKIEIVNTAEPAQINGAIPLVRRTAAGA